MEMESLRDLYLEELKDVYNAEKQLLKALPRMARAATHDELRSAFEDHLNVTEEQVRRLETIFDDLGKPARGKKCVGMEGLIAEGKEMMEEDMEPEVLDAALISAAQRVEHRIAHGLLVVAGHFGDDFLDLRGRVAAAFEKLDDRGVVEWLGHESCLSAR